MYIRLIFSASLRSVVSMNSRGLFHLAMGANLFRKRKGFEFFPVALFPICHLLLLCFSLVSPKPTFSLSTLLFTIDRNPRGLFSFSFSFSSSAPCSFSFSLFSFSFSFSSSAPCSHLASPLASPSPYWTSSYYKQLISKHFPFSCRLKTSRNVFYISLYTAFLWCPAYLVVLLPACRY